MPLMIVAFAERHLPERVAGEPARVADAREDVRAVDDAVARAPCCPSCPGRCCPSSGGRRRPARRCPAGTGCTSPPIRRISYQRTPATPGRRLDRLVRDQRLVVLEVAVGEPAGRPLPVGEDVEVLVRVRDARLRQAVTRGRRAREDRVERRPSAAASSSVSEAVGVERHFTSRSQMFSASNVAPYGAPSSCVPTIGIAVSVFGFCLPSMSAGSSPSPTSGRMPGRCRRGRSSRPGPAGRSPSCSSRARRRRCRTRRSGRTRAS